MAGKGSDGVGQDLQHKIWKIVEFFYKSYLSFREIHDRYEGNVERLCRETGKTREDLHLGPEALSDLIDLKKLEILRDRYLYDLKKQCHELFRGQAETDSLDRYVSDIFHEVSILKEEHYNVKFYATVWQERHARVEYESIMDEAARLFPQKVRHIHYLFDCARDRIEKLLPSVRRQKILMRSLFLNRNGFVRECYREGLEDFYRTMYPENGPIEGYYEVGLSFQASRLLPQALAAFNKGLDAAAGIRERTTAQKRMVRSIRGRARRIERQLEERGSPVR